MLRAWWRRGGRRGYRRAGGPGCGIWRRDPHAQPRPALRPGAGAGGGTAGGGGAVCTPISCIRRPPSTRYAALLTGLPWSCSAHAKDIWTTPDWEKREKLADAAWR